MARVAHMWIKICGMTSPDVVAAALEAGADAIGFVFAPSVRRVEPAAAAALAAPARGRASCVAVMQHPQRALLEEVLAVFRPDVLQTDAADLLDLPSQAHALQAAGSLRFLPVMRGGAAMAGAPPASQPESHAEPLPPRLLFEGPKSGTGAVSDWTRAAQLATQCELVLAGGLGPANVAAAIRAVRPWGVDVSSGVESAPGVKSRGMILEFVTAARAASRES